MAKSVRLSPALEARLREAAAAEGTRVSESIRRAITRHCDGVLGAALKSRVADVVGVVRSRGDRARRTGRAFRKILRSRT